MENYNILVTGAAGLIGSKVYSALKRNNKVVGIDNYSRGVFEDESIIKCDVIDFCKQNQNPFHYIFHFAAINGTSHFYDNPTKVLETNIQIDLAMFNFSKGAKLLYCSSSELVADLSYVPTPEVKEVVINDITNPRHSYKMAKMVGENYLNNSDLDYNIIRFYNIVGENDQSGHFFADIKKKIENKNFELIGAEETRCFCHVDDVVNPLIYLMDEYNTITVNLGSDDEITIKDAADLYAQKVFGYKPKWVYKKSRVGSAKRRVPDLSSAKSYIFNYNVRSFREMMNGWENTT
tara:strand:- start:8015 stop:8890 length:876 start_codon:yes stop_codon:yes gene_type:complete